MKNKKIKNMIIRTKLHLKVYLASNFLQLLLILGVILFSLLNYYVPFQEYKSGIEIYPFLIGDITIVTLYYGIFAPVFKTNNRDTPEAYFTYLKNKIYSKKSFSVIFFMILFHSIGTVVAFYKPTSFLLITNIAVSSTIYLFFLSRIWSFFTREAYNKKILHQFKRWNILVDKDLLRESISKKRKRKYYLLLNEIIAFIPSNENQFSSLYPNGDVILQNYFIFFLSINSGYAFLYDRFKLFKKDEIKPTAFNMNPFQITKEINQFDDKYFEKFSALLTFIKKEEADSLYSSMTIQNINSKIKISTRTMGNLTKLCLAIDKTDWLWSMYFQFLAKYVSSFLTFLSLTEKKATMSSAKNLAINLQYFSSDIFDWYRRLINDKKIIGSSHPSTIYDRLLLQTPFELSKFIRLYEEQFILLLNTSNKNIITYENINTIVRMLDNFIDGMNKIKNLEKESKFDFGKKFKGILELKMREIFPEIKVESIDLTKENEKQETLLNFFIINIINQDEKFARENLYVLIQKIYNFISKYRTEEIKDSLLYGRSDPVSNTEISGMYENLLDLIRAGLAIYPRTSREFKGIVLIVQKIKRISKRGGIQRYPSENNFTKMINQRFDLIKESNIYGEREWFDLYTTREGELEDEKKEYKARDSAKLDI